MATTKDDNPNAVADELANRLANLHRSLEDSGNKGTDWSLASALEDSIGAYQPTAGDFERAEQLLQAHGF